MHIMSIRISDEAHKQLLEATRRHPTVKSKTELLRLILDAALGVGPNIDQVMVAMPEGRQAKLLEATLFCQLALQAVFREKPGLLESLRTEAQQAAADILENRVRPQAPDQQQGPSPREKDEAVLARKRELARLMTARDA